MPESLSFSSTGRISEAGAVYHVILYAPLYFVLSMIAHLLVNFNQSVGFQQDSDFLADAGESSGTTSLVRADFTQIHC
jgi:hypothetical protein